MSEASGGDVRLRAWLEEREPAVPAEFLGRLAPEGAGGGAEGPAPVSEDLLEEGLRALRDALEHVGERDGAFRLLAADAWITYACADAVEEDDADARLLSILDAVVGAGAS